MPALAIYLPPGPLRAGESPTTTLELLQAETPGSLVQLNYRLSHNNPYPGPIHDVLAGYDWIRNNLLARPSDPRSRIAVFGSHIGGGLAAMLALTEGRANQPGRITAAALRDPVLDWVGIDDLSTKDGGDGYVEELLKLRDQIFTKPAQYFDPFASPMLFLRSAGKPIPPHTPSLAEMDDMEQLAVFNRAERARMDAEAARADTEGAAPEQPQTLRKTALRYPSASLGSKLPAFHLTASATSPLRARSEEFATRLRMAHKRQAGRVEFGRKVLSDDEIAQLDKAERAEYDAKSREAEEQVRLVRSRESADAWVKDAAVWLDRLGR